MLTICAALLALAPSQESLARRPLPVRPAPAEPVQISTPVHRDNAAAAGNEVEIDLGDLGHDFEIDVARNLIYASTPARNEIAIIDLDTYLVVDRVLVGTRPHGIDLSSDGSTLYVALHQASSVAYLDLGTRTVVDTINIGTLLGHATTWDVVEAAPDRIFASANPGSGGFAWIVEIDRANGNTASRVASNRIIRAGPNFAKDPNQSSLYVGAGFSPNSLYKLSLIQPNAPIVLEDNHGSVSGTQHVALDPTGSRAYLRSGQILSTSDFSQVGIIGSGPSQISSDGTVAYVANSPGQVELWDTLTQLQTGGMTFPCSSTSFPTTLRLLPNEAGVLVLTGGFLCGVVNSELRSLELTPASGTFISTQSFDAALIVDPGTAMIQSISGTRNGIDISPFFLNAATGMTPSGETTIRLRDRIFETPGRHTVDITVRLDDGTDLVVRGEYDSVETFE